MRADEATRLVREETLGDESIVTAARMGDPIDPARIDRLSAAVRVIFDQLEGAAILDRQLAYSLCLLVTQLPRNVESWLEARNQPLSDVLLNSLLRLEMSVDSVFCGIWSDYTL